MPGQQLGIMIAWINNIILLLFVMIAYLTQRCKFAPMVKLYVITVLILSFIYKAVPGFYSWSYFLQYRAIEYLLIAVAVINLWRAAEYRNIAQRWWFTREGIFTDLKANWWAPLLIFTALFGVYGYYGFLTDIHNMLHPVPYYAPRFILFGAIAFGTTAAFRRMDLLYISFAMLAAGMISADVLKIFESYEHIALIQGTLDQAISLISNVLLILGLFQMEIYRAWRAMRKHATAPWKIAHHSERTVAEAAMSQHSTTGVIIGYESDGSQTPEVDKLLDIYQIGKLIKQDINAARAFIKLNGLESVNVGGIERWPIEDVKKAAGI